MKNLRLDYGRDPDEDQLNRTVSRRGFLRLAAVAAGGSVAALACGVAATPFLPPPSRQLRRRLNPRPGSESRRTTPESKQDRWSSRATALA